ncbi:MAG: hypothetical protein CMC15_07275, partial [Flavobacteriaceae bacterium]|nr:hypothetical protein [Flavobacteriaceae bacterium]
MKYLISIIACAFFLNQSIAQFEPPISIPFNNTQQYLRGLHTADIDGDGDLDVIGGTNEVFWNENTDGLGTFSNSLLIDGDFRQTRSVYAADIDGDGDLDVIAASWEENQVAWYENTDGQGTFGVRNIVSTTATAVNSVKAADFDGDGDVDITAACIADKVTWYENTNGQGAFGTEQIITTNVDFCEEVYIADINGDSFLDLLSISLADNKIAWYENTNGLGNFGTQVLIYVTSPSNVNPSSLLVEDFDNDGDLDIVYTTDTYQQPEFGLLENLDGLGTFSAPQIIVTSLEILHNSVAFDVENDGDIDIITAGYDISSSSTKVSWFPNDGNGLFGNKVDIQVNIGEVWDIAKGNLNGDDFTDVLIGTNSTLNWYANTGEIRDD